MFFVEVLMFDIQTLSDSHRIDSCVFYWSLLLTIHKALTLPCLLRVVWSWRPVTWRSCDVINIVGGCKWLQKIILHFGVGNIYTFFTYPVSQNFSSSWKNDNPNYKTRKSFLYYCKTLFCFITSRHRQWVLSYGIFAYTEFVTKHKHLIVSGSMKQKAAKRWRTDQKRHTFVQEMKTDFPRN